MNKSARVISVLLVVFILALPLSSQASGGSSDRQMAQQIQLAIKVAFIAFGQVPAMIAALFVLMLNQVGWAIIAIIGMPPALTDQPPPQDVAKLDAVKVNQTLPVPEGLR